MNLSWPIDLFARTRTALSNLFANFGTLLATVCWLLLTPAIVHASTVLPKVGMTVGQAHMITEGRAPQALVLGMELPPGSRIRTGPDAVVLLVFPDNARLSLRAGSELIVHRYNLDPSGRDTQMELELVKGAMRQISGTASRNQPERFRLNTPIAAIGVRGTDFLAQTQGDALQAFVHEGAIEVSPVNCITERCAPILLSSASALGAYLHVHRQTIERKNMQLQDVEQLFGLGAMTQRNLNSPGVKMASAGTLPPPVLFSSGSTPLSNAVFIDIRSVPSASSQGQPASNPSEPTERPAAPADSAKTDPSSRPGDSMSPVQPAATPPTDSSATQPGIPPAATTPEAPPPAATPPAATPPATTPPATTPPATVPPSDIAPPTVAPPVVTQLVWGRFGNDPQTLSYQLLKPFALASQERHVTVGLLGQYGLWRNGANGDLQPNLSGTTSFRLASAESYLHEPDRITPASVDKASLQINFNNRTFFTSLQVSHSVTGVQYFQHSGRMNTEGLFAATNDTDRIAGAVSRDGQEAGMLFSRKLPSGNLQGITLWGR